jgi:hypothetical protein
MREINRLDVNGTKQYQQDIYLSIVGDAIPQLTQGRYEVLCSQPLAFSIVSIGSSIASNNNSHAPKNHLTRPTNSTSHP